MTRVRRCSSSKPITVERYSFETSLATSTDHARLPHGGCLASQGEPDTSAASRGGVPTARSARQNTVMPTVQSHPRKGVGTTCWLLPGVVSRGGKSGRRPLGDFRAPRRRTSRRAVSWGSGRSGIATSSRVSCGLQRANSLPGGQGAKAPPGPRGCLVRREIRRWHTAAIEAPREPLQCPDVLHADAVSRGCPVVLLRLRRHYQEYFEARRVASQSRPPRTRARQRGRRMTSSEQRRAVEVQASL